MPRPDWLDDNEDRYQKSNAPHRPCQVHGCHGTINDQGICTDGDGYPEGTRGPREICPTCRGFLSWDGKCFSCWQNGLRDVVPGNRYEMTDGHWRLVVKGPRFVGACEVEGCTMRPAEHVAEGLKAIRAMLAGVHMEAL